VAGIVISGQLRITPQATVLLLELVFADMLSAWRRSPLSTATRLLNGGPDMLLSASVQRLGFAGPGAPSGAPEAPETQQYILASNTPVTKRLWQER
jgi:hypothetical protein